MEAIAPAVSARVEQPHQMRWLPSQCAEIASFVVVADGASPGKIIRFRRTTVFAADNMVHLAAPERILLVDQTILADMVRPLSDETAQPLANLPAHGPAVRGRGPWLAASDALS